MIANIGTKSLAVAVVILKVLWGVVKWTGKFSVRHPKLSSYTLAGAFVFGVAAWGVGGPIAFFRMIVMIVVTIVMIVVMIGWWWVAVIAGAVFCWVMYHLILMQGGDHDRNKDEGDEYWLVRIRRRR